jgi:hypothetical protein
MKIFDLHPTNGRKSFYGKCKVMEDNGVSKLLSYDTVVAEYNHSENKMKVHGYYSPTTARHINAFLSYYGFGTCSKKELENYSV